MYISFSTLNAVLHLDPISLLTDESGLFKSGSGSAKKPGSIQIRIRNTGKHILTAQIFRKSNFCSFYVERFKNVSCGSYSSHISSLSSFDLRWSSSGDTSKLYKETELKYLSRGADQEGFL